MQARTLNAAADASPFGRNLMRALRDRGTTQEAFAREVGVTLRAVQAWCSGQTAMPRWPQIVRIADALGREPAWFLEAHSDDSEPAAA